MTFDQMFSGLLCSFFSLSVASLVCFSHDTIVPFPLGLNSSSSSPFSQCFLGRSYLSPKAFLPLALPRPPCFLCITVIELRVSSPLSSLQRRCNLSALYGRPAPLNPTHDRSHMLSALLSHRRCCFPPAAVRLFITVYSQPRRRSSILHAPLLHRCRHYRLTRHHSCIMTPSKVIPPRNQSCITLCLSKLLPSYRRFV